jgi:uncharacterized linocin/CFP29 family protein
MDDRNAQVGWTEAQWNRVRAEVLEAWQRVRVAGSFLPIYGPLPPSTTVVPSEVLKPNGSVDDRATADLVEIDLPVTLSRQQILEEDLSSALLQFRRRATQLGQLEDWFIFNGTYPSSELSPKAPDEFAKETKAGHPHYRPDLPYLDHLTPSEWAPISGTPRPIAGVDQIRQKEGMRQRNPGSLGLIGASRVEREHNYAKQDEQAQQAQQRAERAQGRAALAVREVRALQARPRAQRQADEAQRQADEAQRQADEAQRQADEAQRQADEARQQADEAREVLDEISPLDNNGLMQAIVKAIDSLEENGYVAPFVCVFGRNPFEEAFISIHNSTVLPRDRIEPLIGRELLHASGIDVLPRRPDLYDPKLDQRDWRSRGVLLSMADEPIDLALASEATPEFRQVDLDGKYVFSVFERFALRIKDAKAIVPLQFERP